jgi:hypothetical protein
MTSQRITKRIVDALKSNDSEFTAWDDSISGFGVAIIDVIPREIDADVFEGVGIDSQLFTEKLLKTVPELWMFFEHLIAGEMTLCP